MIRTRIAPSPTGQDIHIGNLYTALINYVWAKKNHGQFVLRIEDTDRERLIPGAEKQIVQSLNAFSLRPDESPLVGGPYAPYRQSERLPLYQKYAEELVKKGAAYYCFCSKERLEELRKKHQAEKKPPRYDRHCLRMKNLDPPATQVGEALRAGLRFKNQEKFVIRLKIPDNREIVFDDVIRDKITFHSRDLDDQVLLKSDGYPTYHLAVVVDDYLMKISHVIRAEEWISSTPKHILLYEAFGWPKPIFSHLPILRNPDRSKLSKRRGPVWASWYLQQGFLAEAVLNYLALMGWSHPQQKEIFDLQEFIQVFDLKDVKTVGPAFDPVKLEWMNGEYIRKSKVQSLKSKVYEFYGGKYSEEVIEKTIPLIQSRIKKLSDYEGLCAFFFDRPKEYAMDLTSCQLLLAKIKAVLTNVYPWQTNAISQALQDLAKKEKIKTGDFFMILRVVMTGKKISPPLTESMVILGKQECLERLQLS